MNCASRARRYIPIAVLFTLFLSVVPPVDAEPVTTTVYASGTEGYHTFRIPAIIRTPRYLLAFCEGRAAGQGDSGEIDLVLKRSSDGGTTWSALSVVVHDPGFTCGNPAPVYDRDTKEVLLVWTKNPASAHEKRILTGEDPPRTVWIVRSANEGVTWTPPEEISSSTRRKDWRWYATGPGHAIQLVSGRLLVPANHSLGPEFEGWRAHVIYSDDHGLTWAIGGVHQGFTNESTAAELPDGRIYHNMRSYTNENRRRISYSADAGLTWSQDQTDPTLVEPVCQASALSYPESGDRKAGLLFSNPASTAREKITVRWSGDGGQTWPAARELHAGPGAYSDLVMVRDDVAGCLYEQGVKSPYESIVFTQFPLAWLVSAATE